jgi:hypothetical protein
LDQDRKASKNEFHRKASTTLEMAKKHTFVVKCDGELRYFFMVVKKGREPMLLCKQHQYYWKLELDREEGAKWVTRDLTYIKKMLVGKNTNTNTNTKNNDNQLLSSNTTWK